jgi:hypothetical protein
MGDVTDFSNFMGAVIDDRAFAKHKRGHRPRERDARACRSLAGGTTTTASATSSGRRSWSETTHRRVFRDRVLRPDPGRARLRRRRVGGDARQMDVGSPYA